MFELNPFSINYTFVCPDCKCKFGQPERIVFLGTNVVADCLCECCENRYYHTIPTGHAALFPVAFSQKTDRSNYDRELASWFAMPLIASVRENHSVERVISKTLVRPNKDIILLNCLDSCYGHVLLKLFNAQKYIRNYPDKGVIILIQESFIWLMPKGVAEVWSIKAKLSDFNNRISNLDSFIKEEIKNYNSVLLSEVPVHPDIHSIDLKEFLKTNKFDLNEFEQKPFRISFILREDRFWLNNRFDAFLLKICIRYGGLKTMRNYFIWKQNRLIRKLAGEIQRKSKNPINLVAAGLGKTGSLGALIDDQRKETLEGKTEKEWCRLYASSHLVIGIHGSNMLIPTALSAGFIELLPRYKIYHLTEDIAMDHKGRYMQFLGRYLDEFSSVGLVAEHAVSIFNRFPMVKKNMEA